MALLQRYLNKGPVFRVPAIMTIRAGIRRKGWLPIGTIAFDLWSDEHA
tara:strand:+ start:1625 stop:1768 length:144 start_codon:yes stop_codon:yes gene_type:complete